MPARAWERLGILWNIVESHLKINSVNARKGLGRPWKSMEYMESHIKIDSINARKGQGMPWNSIEYNGISHKNQLNQCPQGPGNALE